MYPNPQDVLPLPPRPDVRQYRTRAKELSRACKSGERAAIDAWAERWLRDLARLADDDANHRDRERHARLIADFAYERLTRADCAVTEAQFVIARAHGFSSWPAFARHLDELKVRESGTAAFERAADAVVSGDMATLERLLLDDPSLPRARSAREHGATLLHYVSANGVENYRQKTPANIVAIARLLLDAGADVDAEADVYGGGATTLGLVVTSAHPRAMGVQNALADLLLDRGARMGDPVRSCLMNGCPEAAAHLVQRGAPVRGLEDASGLGDLELVRERWDSGDDAAKSAALRMACWYGHVDVAAFLLERGVAVEARDASGGDTALHVAAYNGHAEVARLLLRHGADVNAIDAVYGTPPLVWALHAWLVDGRPNADDYRATLRVLVEGGADVKPEWIDDDRIRADSVLWSILSR